MNRFSKLNDFPYASTAREAFSEYRNQSTLRVEGTVQEQIDGLMSQIKAEVAQVFAFKKKIWSGTNCMVDITYSNAITEGHEILLRERVAEFEDGLRELGYELPKADSLTVTRSPLGTTYVAWSNTVEFRFKRMVNRPPPI